MPNDGIITSSIMSAAAASSRMIGQVMPSARTTTRGLRSR